MELSMVVLRLAVLPAMKHSSPVRFYCGPEEDSILSWEDLLAVGITNIAAQVWSNYTVEITSSFYYCTKSIDIMIHVSVKIFTSLFPNEKEYNHCSFRAHDLH